MTSTSRFLIRLGIAFALSVAVGCGDSSDHDAGEPALHIETRPDGRVDLSSTTVGLVLRNAWGEALIDTGTGQRTVATRDCAGAWQRLTDSPSDAEYFARTAGWSWRCERDGIALDWRVLNDQRHDTLLAHLRVENRQGASLRVLRLTPLISEGSDAGLFVGANPSRLRILDDGANIAGEVDAKLHYPDEPRNALLDVLLPIASRGNVLANWNHAIVDLDTQRAWIAGALTVERAFPTLGTRLPSLAPTNGTIAGLELIADNALLFRGKAIDADATVESEWLYVAPAVSNVFDGLEAYADAIAAWQGITPWTRRGSGRRVPNGWNSWTGSGGTGGLGTAINETNMSENLDVMARELKPFGVDYFQLDDGYQLGHGDWQANPSRFPSGMPAWSRRVREKGLVPGLWISAFNVDETSTLYAEHPEWMARQRDNALGPLLAPDAGTRVLDLSKPEPVAWVSDTLKRYVDDWGMGWIKLDFAYQALPYAPRESTLTSLEAYKRAIRAIRSAIGDDVFYLGIAMMGLNWGVVDGMRLTLDNAPRWEEPDPFALLSATNSFKSTVRTGARRYYFHNRVWLTHNDLLFFRTDTSQPEPRITVDEARTFASFIGLTGSIVKFGEDLRTLTPEQIQTWRKLLPIYPATARPLDLFRRMYPEQWLLDVDGTLVGGAAKWKVLGLLNWGKNYDYEADGAPRTIEDGPRSYDVDLTAMGFAADRPVLAQEFWSGAFLGEWTNTAHHTIPAHGQAIIALREATGHPQFLGTNRQFTQGATDLLEERWDSGRRTLDLTFAVDQGGSEAVPFEYRWQVYVPSSFRLESADVGQGTLSQSSSVLTIALTPDVPGRVNLKLRFR